YNPLASVYRPGVYYNPWTGRDVVNKGYYNGYTGNSPGGKSPSNPYTGNRSKVGYPQPKERYSSNLYTGGPSAKSPNYNPLKGISKPGGYHNPWTGKDIANKDYYNPYTGSPAEDKSLLNSYTGN